MPIDANVVGSDGWMLQQLYWKLRKQQAHCEENWQRFRGNPPLPHMNPNQREAVKWFVGKSRTNFERLIVTAVLSRLRIRGMRTAADADEGGDAEAYKAWVKARGKKWSRDTHKNALSMGLGFIMVGKDEKTGRLLVTAEDPRHVAVITDPADPFKVIAGIKLIFDKSTDRDIAYYFRLDETDDGNARSRMRRATRSRSVSTPISGYTYDAAAFDWDSFDILETEDGRVVIEDFEPEWLQQDGDLPARLPIVPFENEDGMAEFEPHIELLDRISQQILQRMTIATIQAFKQRAMKGLPKTDPKTGEEINYDDVFIAEPGAIWNIPAAVEIWESGAVDLQPILLSIRDDIKDLAAVSGTPLYTVTPDVANGSAEGASLQREQLTFKVESRQGDWEISHGLVAELIFRTEDMDDRVEPGTQQVMWAPADRPSLSERANAIAQTRDVIPTYIQLIEIWGMPPDQADQAMTLLREQKAEAAALAPTPAQPQQPQLRPDNKNVTIRPKGLPDVTKPVAPRAQGPAPA